MHLLSSTNAFRNILLFIILLYSAFRLVAIILATQQSLVCAVGDTVTTRVYQTQVGKHAVYTPRPQYRRGQALSPK